MADYISREAFLRWAREFYPDPVLISGIINAPAADVEQVRHGNWTRKKDNDGFPYFEHEECGKKYRLIGGLQYCPNCGAKMDGGADDAV